VEAEDRDQSGRNECAEHVELAMGKVHDPHDAEYDGEAEGRDYVTDAIGEPEDGKLCNKIDHASLPPRAVDYRPAHFHRSTLPAESNWRSCFRTWDRVRPRHVVKNGYEFNSHRARSDVSDP
jgi:hypothetical protein